VTSITDTSTSAPGIDRTTFLRLFRPEDRSLTVERVILSGAPVDASLSDGVLHWHLILALRSQDGQGDDDDGSTGPLDPQYRYVTVDMLLGDTGADGCRVGILMLKSLSSPEEFEEIKSDAKLTCEFDALPSTTSTTAQSILDLLLSLGRNRYTYTADGSGCRHWCEVVLQDLEAIGVVAPGATEMFMKRIKEGYERQPSRFPWPSREGAFY
jgi:hypothetical protein